MPMNLPTSVVITGCDSLTILQQASGRGSQFSQPLDSSQVGGSSWKKRRKPRKAGKFELYKTSHQFDGTYAKPTVAGLETQRF